MKKILILNGPNLNMLGTREPEIYGHKTLQDIENECKTIAHEENINVVFKQSNHEGELVTWIQECVTQQYDGIIINAAAYTHTSVAIHDALKTLDVPIIELHISDPKKREKFRHHSYVEPLATKVIAGHGTDGYTMALKEITKLL